jgi:hypothetical protein
MYPYYNELGRYPEFEAGNRSSNEKAVAGTIKEIVYPTGGKTVFEFENNKIYAVDNVYTIKKESFSMSQRDYGQKEGTFTTISQKVDIRIEMSIHPVGIYHTEIILLCMDNNKNILHFTQLSVPGNGFVNAGTNSDGTQKFILNASNYYLPAGTYKWITKITHMPGEKPVTPSPIVVSNDFYREVPSTETREKPVGGLRIARISNYDADGEVTDQVKYKYLGKDGKSSGTGLVSPEFIRTYVVTEKTPHNTQHIAVDLELIEIGEKSINYYDGNPIQYIHVTEERSNGDMPVLRTDYEYRKREYYSNRYPHVSGYNTVPNSPNDYEAGLLIKKTDYKYENNAYIPVKKTTNTYNIINLGNEIPSFTALTVKEYHTGWRSHSEWSHAHKESIAHEIFKIGTYDFKAAKVYLASTQTEEITQTGTIISSSEYFYDNPQYLQLTHSKQIQSNGKTIELNYKYCYDDNSDISNEMKARNILSFPLGKTTLYNNHPVKKITTQYAKFNTEGIIEPKVMREETNEPTMGWQTIFYKYDDSGNPIHLSKDGHKNTFYLWSYKGKYLVATIEGGKYTFSEIETAVANVFSVSGINTFSRLEKPDESKLKHGDLQQALPNALITTYTYKPLYGMTSKTDANCIIITYDYDSFGRLQYIKDHSGKIIEQYDYHYKP